METEDGIAFSSLPFASKIELKEIANLWKKESELVQYDETGNGWQLGFLVHIDKNNTDTPYAVVNVAKGYLYWSESIMELNKG